MDGSERRGSQSQAMEEQAAVAQLNRNNRPENGAVSGQRRSSLMMRGVVCQLLPCIYAQQANVLTCVFSNNDTYKYIVYILVWRGTTADYSIFTHLAKIYTPNNH